LLNAVDATDITEVCVINQYVICNECKLLIPDVDNLDDHVCESGAFLEKGQGEIVVQSSAKGYKCEYCSKTFAQVSSVCKLSLFVVYDLAGMELQDDGRCGRCQCGIW